MSNEYSNWDYVAQEPPRGVCMVEGHYIRIYIIDPLDTYSGHYSQWRHTPPACTTKPYITQKLGEPYIKPLYRKAHAVKPADPYLTPAIES